MHNRGRVERNAGQAWSREGVNAKRLARRKEQQRRVSDITQDRVKGRAREGQGRGNDEGAQPGGWWAKEHSRVEGMAGGQKQGGKHGPGRGMVCQVRSGQGNTEQGKAGRAGRAGKGRAEQSRAT